MDPLLKDLRHALRQLARNPAFAITAIATLALGIGAVTTVFSVIRVAVLQPPPYPDPDRLVILWSQNLSAGVTRAGTGYANVADWRARNQSFAALASFDGTTVIATEPGSQPRRVSAALIEPQVFAVLGLGPQLGRFPTVEEMERREPVAVIGHSAWRRLGGGDVLGRRLEIDGVLFSICGVAPPGFDFFNPGTDLWLPLSFARAWETERLNRGTESLRVIGRLAPGVTPEGARAEMGAIAGALAREHPMENRGLGVDLVPFSRHLGGPQLRVALALLAGAVAALLLIACSNVANLLLVRGMARQREFAVRLSLGATRGQLVAQILAETLVLGLLAAALGAGLAWLALPAVRAFSPADIPHLAQLQLHAPLLAISTFGSLTCVVLSGLAPALQATRRDPLAMLRAGGRGATENQAGRRIRAGLVGLEFALTAALLAGAGLLITSFARLLAIDPGFQPKGVLVASSRYPASRPLAEVGPYFQRLQERVGALPGVVSTAVTEDVLMGPKRDQSVIVEVPGAQAPAEFQLPVGVDSVTPGLFETLGIALRRGRLLHEHDHADGQRVVVINEHLAAKLWPGQDAVGLRLRTERDGPWMTVVGVVADVRRQGPDREPIAQLFRPFAQRPSRGFTLVVRTAGDPAALAASLRLAAEEVDRGVPEFEVSPLELSLRRQTAPQRFNTTLLGAFGTLALVLAGVGIYGLMHYSVARRTQEIGVRVAVGADPAGVRWMIVREGLGLAAGGVAVGLLAAFLGLGGISSLLFGVSARDPRIYAASAGVLLLLAFFASWLPALRASQIDPSVALRAE